MVSGWSLLPMRPRTIAAGAYVSMTATVVLGIVGWGGSAVGFVYLFGTRSGRAGCWRDVVCLVVSTMLVPIRTHSQGAVLSHCDGMA